MEYFEMIKINHEETLGATPDQVSWSFLRHGLDCAT